MKIELTRLESFNPVISLTDEGLNNDNFVTICIDSTDISQETFDIDVDLNELLAAIHAFEHKRILRVNRENVK